VTPQSVIGAATTPRLSVVIEPKLSIDRVFWLLGYARKIRFAPDPTTLIAREGIVEAFVAAFLDSLQRALRRGLPMSYVAREEALATIRGRVRFAEQLRRRYELPLPVEVGYDDYTIDTEANRLVKAALRRIERIRLRNTLLRRRTAESLSSCDGVTSGARGVLDPRGAGGRGDRAFVVVLPAHAHSERIEAEHLLDRSRPRRLTDSLALDHQTVSLSDLHGLPQFSYPFTACVPRHTVLVIACPAPNFVVPTYPNFLAFGPLVLAKGTPVLRDGRLMFWRCPRGRWPFLGCCRAFGRVLSTPLGCRP
jgi:hypothetical protein